MAVAISGDGAVFPDRFAGIEDGLDWLGNFELYCRYKGIIKDDGTLQCEPQIKSLLAVLLTDGAKLWFDSVAAADRDTWAKLRALFVERFSEQKFLKFRHSKEMFTTKQGLKEPVREYISRIQSLARKSSDAPSVDVIIHAVMAGVKGYIAGFLAEKAPTTIVDLIKHATVAESTLGDTEPVSSSQLQQLQDDMKAQFNALSIKLGAGAVANVVGDREPRVRFSPATSRSSSTERTRYSRLRNERDDDRRPHQIDDRMTHSRPVSRDRDDYRRPADSRPHARSQQSHEGRGYNPSTEERYGGRGRGDRGRAERARAGGNRIQGGQEARPSQYPFHRRSAGRDGDAVRHDYRTAQAVLHVVGICA